MSSTSPYGRRADAERNRSNLLDCATRLLAEDSSAGMAEVAAAAGVGRATLYRHFPTREDLLAAIETRALDETEEAIAASRLDDGTATEALRRLVDAMLQVGDRYRFLFAEDQRALPDDEREAREDRLGAPLFALVERGQEAGEFSRVLTARWMLGVFGAVLVAALQAMAAGELERERAAGVVTATLLHGYSHA
jgi:TetR/AcrR family transcriptional regulator, mexCD-oprJ operon repressor